MFNEISDHLTNIGADDVHYVSKNVWKKRSKNYIRELNRAQLLEDIKKYKKLDYNEMSKETFERKEYFYKLNLEDIRLRFKISSQVVPSVRTSFPGKYRENGLHCPSCTTVEETNQPLGRISPTVSNPTDSLNHIMLHCPAYGKFRDGRNLECDQQLVEFVKDAIQYRMENNQA